MSTFNSFRPPQGYVKVLSYHLSVGLYVWMLVWMDKDFVAEVLWTEWTNTIILSPLKVLGIPVKLY